jgi:4'-phosphopantetheinyl transferase
VAACALTSDPQARIGIDIDLVEARDPSFLSDYFTVTEQAFTRALPAHLRDRWVTLAWSAKESALKAMRTGLRIDTRSVQVGSPRGLFLEESKDGEWKTLSVHCVDEPEGVWQGWWRKRGDFVLTLACRGGEPPWILEEV